MSAADRMRRYRARQREGLVPLTIEADEVNTVEVLIHFGFLKAETEDRHEIARAFSRCWAWLTTHKV